MARWLKAYLSRGAVLLLAPERSQNLQVQGLLESKLWAAP